MSYNEDFYKRYTEYLKEPQVRLNHDRMFNIFTDDDCIPNTQYVIELGCGTGEFREHTDPMYYYGVDKVDSPAAGEVLDYTEKLPALDFHPNVFVSLFSAESCLPNEARYDLYERVFAEWPSVYAGLVSGFYYEGKEDQVTVEEAGGLVSFQTLPRFEGTSKTFKESWTFMKTPSKLFGDNVVEVWKILERRL